MRIPGSSLSAFLTAAAVLAPVESFHPVAHQSSRVARGWVARRNVPAGPRTPTPQTSRLRSSFFEDDFGEYSDFADAARSSSSSEGGSSSSSNLPSPVPDRSPAPISGGGGSSSSSAPASPSTAMGDDLFLASLQARRTELTQTYTSATATSKNGKDDDIDDELRIRWLNADISSAHAGLALSDDWIRRVAFHRYPLAVCGTASGSIVAADLESGEELCRAEGAHGDDLGADDPDDERRGAMGRAMTKLYGEFDGGGVVAIATWGDWIASSGRDLGVRLHKLDPERPGSKSSKLKLSNKGRVEGLEDALVTGLAFDSDGALWVGGFDLRDGKKGTLRCYDVEGEADEAQNGDSMEPLHKMDLGAEVLSLSLDETIGCGVAGLADGRVTLFSLDDGEVLDSWKPPFRGFGTHARSALVVQNAAADDDFADGLVSSLDDKDDDGDGDGDDGKHEDRGDVWSVAVGASDGTMFVRRLNVDAATGRICDERPFHDTTEDANHAAGPLRPRHAEAVVALASPFRGVLVSGAQDGSIRVWDCSYPRLLDLEEVQEYEDEDGLVDDDTGDEAEANYDDVGDDKDLRPRCLYAMTGYKVWLGSVCTDGKRIVSDGSDNAVIVHDFRPEAASANDDFLELD